MPVLANDGHLDVRRLEVHAEHSLEAADGLLNCLGLRELEILLLDDLLECVHGLLVLRTRGARLVAVVHACGVHLEERAALLVIDAEEHGADAVRPHVGVLRVDLADVRDLQGEEVHGDLIPVRVFEFGRDLTSLEDERPTIRRHARHQRADVGRDVVDVSHEILVHELVRDLPLGHRHDAIFPLQGHGGHVLIFLHGLVGILHLMQPPLR
mmetsp:Transcript_163543/g.524384  ORF Transcript_163543/g.524384 Transcript_163543/m.524384 type:complete len:211 (+) Transcript_163543:190-822(+)